MIGLRRGQEERVRVLVPRVATLEATVVRAVTGAAELALTATPDVPLRFLHRRKATIVPLTGDDRIDGTAARRARARTAASATTSCTS